jgi:hypothetical protein
MTAEWIANQLSRIGAARRHAPQMPRFNPRPAGQIRPGSATDAVLKLLVVRYPAFLNHAQIQAQTGCTGGSMAWAISYLKAQKHIESTTDDGRNLRYSKYRATPQGIEHASSRA